MVADSWTLKIRDTGYIQPWVEKINEEKKPNIHHKNQQLIITGYIHKYAK